ncbi:uncharacterized protein [Cicer arietinum]|uniref:uncharacterized protein n=1 Tax=Cicer arietinum TaxID=3827 RepID=UPI003CC58770
MAKNKAIETIYGNWEKSYNDIPRWLLTMQKFLPGTIVEMEVSLAYSDNTLLQGSKIFKRLFWAFPPCISGFKFCKPFVSVDGTWLYRKYKGILLLAVAQDGNKNTIPIAYALMEGYALNEPSFKYYRNEIKMENPEALRWIDNIPPEQWTMAYYQGRRWGHITTNVSESINAVLKGTRNLPITALVQPTYYRLRVLYAERGQQHQASLASGRVYTDDCMDKIKCEVGKSNTHQVMQFDRNHYSFMVHETVNPREVQPIGHFEVNLQRKWCDCGKFQALHVPCSHVIDACSYAR